MKLDPAQAHTNVAVAFLLCIVPATPIAAVLALLNLYEANRLPDRAANHDVAVGYAQAFMFWLHLRVGLSRKHPQA